MPDNPNSYVGTLTPEQSKALLERLSDGNWELSQVPYAIFRAKRDKVSVTAYESGKLVVQGKGTAEFIEFILEPEILKAVLVPEPSAPADPEEFLLHGGIDESGKGDFFGPLCVAGVIVTPETAVKLREMGVKDSKQISSDRQIIALSAKIRETVGANHTVLRLPPVTYNDLYCRIGNLNRLLAWGHARVIENLLEIMPECPRMLSDKFGDESLIRRALMEKGRKIRLDQRCKGENDIAVAAASILAREAFVYGVKKLEEVCGVTLPKGAGPSVKEQGRSIFLRSGAEGLRKVAKEHFKTFEEACHGL